MSNVWVVGLLTYAHIFSAIGWLGAVVTMNFALAPLMNRFAPSTRIDLLSLFLPRFARMTTIFAGLTVLFGAGLYTQVYAGSSQTWLLVIGVGIILSLVAFVDGLILIVPLTNRLSTMAKDMAAQPAGPPSTEFSKSLRGLQVSAIASMLLLVAALAFMVAAGQI